MPDVMNKTVKAVLVIIGLIALIGALWYLRAILFYLLVAVVLTLIGRPLMNFLERVSIRGFRLPPAVCALITIVIYLLVFVGFVSLFIPLVVQEIRILSQVRISEVIFSLQEPLKGFEHWLEENKLVENISLPMIIQEQLAGVIRVGDIPSFFGTLVGKLGGIFITFFSIFFMTFFFLKDKHMVGNLVLEITPASAEERVMRVLTNTKHLLTRYFVGILLQVIGVMTVVGIGLSIVGIENAIVIGFIAGLINIVPYLGPVLGAVLAVVVGITTNLELDFYSGMLPLCGKILLVFIVVQLMDNFLFQPLIFSRSAKAHPLEIFIVILIGATLAGITGMILAVPGYIFIRIVAKEFLSEFRVVKTLTRGL